MSTDTQARSMLDTDLRKLFSQFLDDCEAVGIEREWMREQANAAKRFHRGAGEPPAAYTELENRWYESFDVGPPDYDVYSGKEYVVDLWGCWCAYSRGYLRDIPKPRVFPPDGIASALGVVDAVADLGCGIAYTSEGLTEVFKGALVCGTNLRDTKQWEIAKLVSKRNERVRLFEDPAEIGAVDLVFASEYFEHFDSPIDHLRYVLDSLEPRALLIASTFGSRSIGHFDEYRFNGQLHTGRGIASLFGKTLRAAGYIKMETTLWNSRPTFWLRSTDGVQLSLVSS